MDQDSDNQLFNTITTIILIIFIFEIFICIFCTYICFHEYIYYMPLLEDDTEEV